MVLTNKQRQNVAYTATENSACPIVLPLPEGEIFTQTYLRLREKMSNFMFTRTSKLRAMPWKLSSLSILRYIKLETDRMRQRTYSCKGVEGVVLVWQIKICYCCVQSHVRWKAGGDEQLY